MKKFSRWAIIIYFSLLALDLIIQSAQILNSPLTQGIVNSYSLSLAAVAFTFVTGAFFGLIGFAFGHLAVKSFLAMRTYFRTSKIIYCIGGLFLFILCIVIFLMLTYAAFAPGGVFALLNLEFTLFK